jgi:hypothetical protein
MSKIGVICVGVLAVASLCASAPAAVVFLYEVGQPSYQIPAGGSVDVPIYLAETVSAPDTSLLVSESGLANAGFLVQRTGTSLSDPVAIASLADEPVQFNDPGGPTITVSGEAASLFEMRDIFSPTGAMADETYPGSGVRRILLGTATVGPGGTIGEVTTFQVTRASMDTTNTWSSFTLLDDQINSTSFTVAVTPEPSTLALLGLGALAFARRRKRQ